MRLTDVIRGTVSLRAGATDTVATPATNEPSNAPSVATVASVRVADPQLHKAHRLTFVDEMSIRTWLAGIGEHDRETVADVIKRCRVNAEVRAYFLELASDKAKGVAWNDDRIRCQDCLNLSFAGICLLACPAGPVIAQKGYKPIDLPHRCECFKRKS